MNKLIANERAYQTLAASVRGGRLSHALLIEGPAGCGKTVFAGEIAQAALCSAPREERPCGVCRDCVKAEKGIHPDILTYSGAGGSRSFHIDTVRALRQQAYICPNEAEGKVLILTDCQDMTPQAQNALLKVMEEPPRGVTLVLTCDNRAALLETILSRVQVIRLETPAPEECARYLRKRMPEADPGRIQQAAGQAGGRVGSALALLEQDGGPDSGAAELLYHLCIGEEFTALRVLHAYERDRQGLTALLGRLAAVLGGVLLHPPEEGPLAQLSSRLGRLRLLRILAIIEGTADAVAGNANGLLLVTGLSAGIRTVLADPSPYPACER